MDNGVKNKNKFDHIQLDFGQMRAFHTIFERNKSKRDHVSWLKAYLVYVWIYVWQLRTKVGFGRVRKQDVFEQIGETFIEPKPNVVVNALIRAGMVTWGKSEYKGITNYCLQCTYLNEKMGNGDMNTKQAENEVVQLESSAKGSAENGEYYEYGKRFYRDNNGDSHIVPHDAPQRPNNTASWNGKQWRESEAAKQSIPSQIKTENYEEQKMSVGIVWFPGGYYGYQDENGNICKDYDGNICYIPKPAAFNRPSIKHVFDFEVLRWCLPDEVTVRDDGF